MPPHCSQDHAEAVLHRISCICDEQQLRLTPLRRQVLELVVQSPGAVKAYELIERYAAETDTQAKPPTIYRTLDFLLEHTFIHRIESLNAYVRCDHPDQPHVCQFFICTACGQVEEMHFPAVEQAIHNASRDIGFLPQHQAIELTGLCAACR